MPWFPWHPEQVEDPAGPAPLLLTGQPAKWASLSNATGRGPNSYDPIVLFSDGLGNDLDPADIRQGKLAANVWLLSALAVITEYPDAVPMLFTDRTRGLQDLTKIRLFIKSTGKWRIMSIDDSLPYGLKDKKPMFATLARRRDMPSEAWLPLLEKAFATLVGGYPGLSGGQPWAALEAMTGDAVQVFTFDDAKNRWAHLKVDGDLVFHASPAGVAAASSPPEVSASHDSVDMWAILVDAYRKGQIIALTTEGVIATGAQDRQAYGVIELHEVGGVRLLCVRNPWGTFRWTGDWSHGSDLWDTRQDVLDAVNPVLESDGEFYMSLEDCGATFHQLLICQRGATKTSSLKFLTQAAFTEASDLARQTGLALAARRLNVKNMHGAQSCLPRSRNMFNSLGAAAGASLYRAGSFINRCASVARKNSIVPPFGGWARPQHQVASAAEATTTLDNGAGEAGPPGSLTAALGAPAAGSTVIGRPVRAAVAALRSYWRPEDAAAAAAGAAGEAAGDTAVQQPPGGGARGTVLGYAAPAWGPPVLRAYWSRREPAAAAHAAPPVAAGGGATEGAAHELRGSGQEEPVSP